jgi:hypothetical protein
MFFLVEKNQIRIARWFQGQLFIPYSLVLTSGVIRKEPSFSASFFFFHLFLNGQRVNTAIEVTYFLHDFKFKIFHIFVGGLRVVPKTRGAPVSLTHEN